MGAWPSGTFCRALGCMSQTILHGEKDGDTLPALLSHWSRAVPGLCFQFCGTSEKSQGRKQEDRPQAEAWPCQHTPALNRPLLVTAARGVGVARVVYNASTTQCSGETTLRLQPSSMAFLLLVRDTEDLWFQVSSHPRLEFWLSDLQVLFSLLLPSPPFKRSLN